MKKYLLILVLLLSSCGHKVSHFSKNEIVTRKEIVLQEKKTPLLKAPIKAPPLKVAPPPVAVPQEPVKAKPIVKPLTLPPSPPTIVSPKVKKGPLIVLDPGHGGKDTGALSKKNAYEEKELTLVTANMVKKYLNQMGYEVVMTRTKDMFVSLEGRAEMANTLKAALFVSVHYNYCPNDEAEGIEVFYHKDEKNPYTKRLIESRKLGETVLSGIVKHTGATPRGVKKANFAVIRETKMPAILIEGGFLSNPSERGKILDPPYLKFLAYGIASGIDKYYTSIPKNIVK